MADFSALQIGNNTYDVKDIIARIQKTTLPAASSTEAGNIYQYTGTTGNGLTNGYFYKCVNNNGTYEWQAISVQAGGGGSSRLPFVVTGTLSSNGWTETSTTTTGITTYINTQSISDANVLATDMPIADVVVTPPMQDTLLEAWSKVYAVSTSNGSITFTCYSSTSGDAPTQSIYVNVLLIPTV